MKDLERQKIESLLQDLRQKKIQKKLQRKPTPLEKVPRRTYPQRFPLFLFLLIAVPATAYYFLRTNNIGQTPIKNNLPELQKLKNEEEKSLKEIKKIFLQKKSIIEKLTHKRPFFRGILKELSIIIPEGISLSEILIKTDQENNNLLSLSGHVINKYDNQQILKTFLNIMTRSPFFSEIKTTDFQKDREGKKIYFTMQGKIVI